MTGPRLLWQRWEEADRILSAAMDLPVEERQALVRREVPEPGEFQDLVLRLVAGLAADHERVTAPSGELVAAAFGSGAGGEEPDLPPGTEVGRYRILERLARGGMATVYVAERADGVYRQRVALKVLRRGLDTEDVVGRFHRERQILSSLTHPNIAKLLDGGSLPDGRPFLVMELVEGERITAFADARRLDVRRRLGLFLGVAEAVQAAHRQLVVHRDIKASNILVDADGRVKLLDFGIAKLVAGDSVHTAVDARPLTPAYASPEQLAGGPITTATDVYQLGLLLRELLTGVRPGRRDGRREEVTSRISRMVVQPFEGLPPPAERASHRGTSPERLAGALRGDLEQVVSKAVRPEPEERYPSAGDMAADIRRHLQGRPVLAHPQSVLYRARKFAGRNRWGVLAASAMTLLLLGYGVTLVVQNRRVATERDRAAQEARKAAEVTEFMVDLFHAADPNRTGGSEISVQELLRDGARQLREETVAEPGVRAAMLTAIGRSFSQLGYYQEAEEQLEHAVRAHREDPDAEPGAYAQSLSLLAQVVGRRDRDSSLVLFEEAREAAERSLGPEHPVVAGILTESSIALAALNPVDPDVEARRARAVAILRAATTDVRGELANALTVWAHGKPPVEAIPLMQESLELRRAIHPERHSAVAASLSDLGLAMESVDPLAADSLLAQSVAILQVIHGRPDAVLLTTMNNLAALRRDRGDFAGAEPLYRQVLAIRRELYPEQRVAEAFSLYGLGVVLAETGRAPEGEARLEEALAIMGEETPTSQLLPLVRAGIGHARARQGRYAAAESVLVSAWREIRASALPTGERVRTLGRLVSLYESWGRPAQAASYRRQLDSLTGTIPSLSAR
jgi:eukaryotic-like serine/threonine-protein kinase